LAGSADAPHVPREILHILDDEWRVSAIQLGQWKYVNGTTSAGQYDSVLTYRELDNLDPRESSYPVTVRNSATSRALSRYDLRRLTQRRISTIRQSATVHCGDLQRSCNPLVEECLYDVETDPCEQNNLVYSARHSDVLAALQRRIRELRASASTPGNRASMAEANPTWHTCAWETFEVQTPKLVPLECDYQGVPC
uniref:Uncharacterized protein LOC108039776 n=1 Tax=Drosophila rhopaloa TaxID=1041015 RepID=A0A6P4E755_DRORH